VILLLVILQSALAQMEEPERIITPSGYPMRRIPAGTFTMGCTPEQELSLNDVRESPDCDEDEKPAHTVNITFPFFMGEVEVTRGVYRDVSGGAPKAWSCTSNDCPAVMVSWNDAVALANEMSLKEGLKPCYTIQGENVSWPEGLLCEGYRLPTEAEWEHAARAGDGFKYPGSNDPDQVAWYESNSGRDAHRVGGKAPNSWGIYDMSGNAWEWVWDGWLAYSEGKAADPVGTLTEHRVLRGGSEGSPSRYLRVASRAGDRPGKRYSDVGFRIVRTDPAHLAAIAAAAKQDELAKQVLLADVNDVDFENNNRLDQEENETTYICFGLFLLAVVIFIMQYYATGHKNTTNHNENKIYGPLGLSPQEKAMIDFFEKERDEHIKRINKQKIKKFGVEVGLSNPTPTFDDATSSISSISTKNHALESLPAGVKVIVPVGFIVPFKINGGVLGYLKRTESGYVSVNVTEGGRVPFDDETLLLVDDAVIDCFFTVHRS
jgi:sulfatase modifying factor 1